MHDVRTLPRLSVHGPLEGVSHVAVLFCSRGALNNSLKPLASVARCCLWCVELGGLCRVVYCVQIQYRSVKIKPLPGHRRAARSEPPARAPRSAASESPDPQSITETDHTRERMTRTPERSLYISRGPRGGPGAPLALAAVIPRGSEKSTV